MLDNARGTMRQVQAVAHRRLTLIATALVAFGSASSAIGAQGPSGSSQDRRPVVAVLDYINASMRTDADYKVLSKGISTVLAGRLGETDSIRIVTREKLQEIMAEQNLGTSGRVDAGQAVQVGKLLNAHHIIYGTYLVQPNGDTRITASAYSVETSEMEYSTQVRGSADKLQDLIDQLGDKLATGMKLPAARARQTGKASGPATPNAPRPTGNLSELVILSKAIDADDRKATAEAIPLYKMFLAKTPPSSYVAQRRVAEARIRENGGGE
jgi:curli production assembly/transport component CsgG